MGYRTETETIPYKIEVWSGRDPANKGSGHEALDRLFHYLEITTYEHEAGSKQEDPLPEFLERGWLLHLQSQYRKLFIDKLVKNGYEVHYVDESPCPVSCVEITCFFSDDRSALEQFCRDWEFDISKIEEGKAVRQTL